MIHHILQGAHESGRIARQRDFHLALARAYLLLVFGLLRRGRLLHLLLGRQKIVSRESAVRNTASRKGKARVRAQTCSQCGDFLFEAHAASPGREELDMERPREETLDGAPSEPLPDICDATQPSLQL